MGETDQFCLSHKHRSRLSWGTLSVGRSSVEKGSMVALTKTSLLEIKKSEGKNLLGLSSFPELLH